MNYNSRWEKATLKQMHEFLVKWPCVCALCPICIACLEVMRMEEEE